MQKDLFVDTEYENSGPEASGLEFENLEIWKFENWMLRVNWSRSMWIEFGIFKHRL
jgi:hypothetical protein